MRFAIPELADALDATIHGTVPRVGVVDGLATDSRELRTGQLFAAITAERDGHDFVPAAVAAGAAAVLVERPMPDTCSLVVADVAAALATLARHARGRVPGRVVGITGSVGKTTTKDLLAGVLAQQFRTAASERSFNNELGVPLTLCNAADDVEAVVVEMGARGAGHITKLCSMASPTVGVVTTVAAVHTELMGGLDAIAEAKGELIEALPGDGLAVLNAEVPRVAAMAARSAATVLRFGEGGDVFAEHVVVDAELRPHFVLASPWGRVEVDLSVRGQHNVGNALAAATVGLGLEVPLEAVAEGLAESVASPWRMELRTSPSGARILNDAYNAGPASMEAALRSLATLDAQRRAAVVGVMAELGADAAEEHHRITTLAQSLGIELVVVGTDLYGPDPQPDAAAALQAIGDLGPGDAVLVKGSRVAGLESVAQALLEPER